jgi:hypothetical protein
MKTLILSHYAVMCSLFLFAQIGLGIKAGANFANVSTDNVDTKSKTSFSRRCLCQH